MSKEEEFGLNEVDEDFSAYPPEFQKSSESSILQKAVLDTNNDLTTVLENHLELERIPLQSDWSTFTIEKNLFIPPSSTQIVSPNFGYEELLHVNNNEQRNKRRKTNNKITKNKKQEMKFRAIDEKSVLISLLSLIEESLLIIKSQMEILLDTQYKMCMEKQKLLKKKYSYFEKEQNIGLTSKRGNFSIGFFSQFKAPYFKNFDYFPCPQNDDSLEFIKREPYKHYEPWSNLDILNLQNCVREVIVQAYLSVEKKSCKDISSVDYDTKIECLKTIYYFRKEPFSSFLTKGMEDNLDWFTIAELTNKFNPRECKTIWNLFCKPSVCKKEWSENEANKLKQLADAHDLQNWETVASDLGTSRSGFQCFLYYLKFVHNGNILGAWTQHETRFLNSVISKSTYGNKICWNKVCYYIEGRSFHQLYNKWKNGSNPNLKKGRFEQKEDKLLLTLKDKFNLNFEEIAKVVKNRTSTQLRERYLTSLNPQVQFKVGEWTEEEDKLLLKLISEIGEKKWSAIAHKFKTRNRMQIRHRYLCLLKKKMANPNLELSHLKRYKRSTNNKKKRENSKEFIKHLKQIKNNKANLSDVNKSVDSVYKSKTKLSKVDLDLVKFFARDLDTGILNLDDVKKVSDYSLGTLTEEIRNVLSVLKTDLKFDEKVLGQLAKEVESNSLGKSGKKILNLLQENYLAKRIFDQSHQSNSNNDANNLYLLPPNFNTLSSLSLMLDSYRRGRSNKEYIITFDKNDFTPEDLALLTWHSRFHSLFIWPIILSMNKYQKL